MGTDIHGVIEVKNSSWSIASTLKLSRNYGAFNVLFGVRESFNLPALAAGRGIPKDIDPAVYNESKHSIGITSEDSHSQTWILANELLEGLDREVTFTIIRPKGWDAKARRRFKEFRQQMYDLTLEAHHDKDEAERVANEWYPDEDEYVQTYGDLITCFYPGTGSKPQLGWSRNMSPEHLMEFIRLDLAEKGIVKGRQGPQLEYEAPSMDQIAVLAAKHPDKYEVISNSMKLRDVNKWLDKKTFADWNKMIVRLEKLSKVHGGDNVRLVVWFDN